MGTKRCKACSKGSDDVLQSFAVTTEGCSTTIAPAWISGDKAGKAKVEAEAKKKCDGRSDKSECQNVTVSYYNKKTGNSGMGMFKCPATPPV